ncbi:MAG: hypothetical protein F3745_02180, partial [Nitrospinae bacterium]|nr:hypothetical protein [Nitrospinota bacterium]
MHMKNWFMLSVIGIDQPSIVASLSAGLCKNGCNLGDSSMVRLGKYFTIMLMVGHDGDAGEVEAMLVPITEELGLRLPVADHYLTVAGLLPDRVGHIPAIGESCEVEPGVRVTVLAADDRRGETGRLVLDPSVPR